MAVAVLTLPQLGETALQESHLPLQVQQPLGQVVAEEEVITTLLLELVVLEAEVTALEERLPQVVAAR